MMIYTRIPKHNRRKKKKAKSVAPVSYAHITLFGKPVNIDRKTKVVATYQPSPVYRRDESRLPSLNSNVGNTHLKEPMKYTGTLIKGIATMHKSNAVPVINQEEMISISRMRRG